MTRLAQAAAIHVLITALVPRLGLMARARRHLKGLNAAHARQLRHMSLGGEVCDDLALPPQEILGEPSHDPALPFFFQAGFDRH